MINCDSFFFTRAAQYPSLLLAKNYTRQSRPVYVFIGSIVGFPISTATSFVPLSDAAKNRVNQIRPLTIKSPEDKVSYYSYFVGLIFLNFLFLYISLLLFDSIVDILTDGIFPKVLTILCSLFLASNLLIKMNFFSPHQQMLAILSPLLCCYVGLKIALSKQITLKYIILISLASGVAVLMYGSFLLLLPMMLAAMYLQFRQHGGKKLKDYVVLSLVSALLFFAPTLAWVAIVTSINGSFYSHEVAAYRQFVWMSDSLKIGLPTFFDQLSAITNDYLQTLKLIYPFFFLLVGLLLFNFVSKNNSADSAVTNSSLKRTILAIAFVLYFVFFMLLGYYAERLTFTLFPILLCFISLELALWRKSQRSLNKPAMIAGIAIAAGAWIIYNVFSYGPFE